MARKASLLNPGLVGPSGGPFGDTTAGKITALSPFGRGRARQRIVTTLKRGGKVPRFDFGGLFGGQPGTTQQTGMQSGMSTGATNNNIASAGYNTLRENVLDAAGNLDFSDPSKYIAGFNADQQNAFEGVRQNQNVYAGDFNNAQGAIDRGTATASGIQGSAQPYVDQAGQMQTGTQAFNPFATQASQGANTTVGNYMSPYQSQAMDAVGAASNKAFGAPGGPMERINDTFTGGNAAQFGRERHGDAMGNAVYNQQQALDQQLAQMANTGWQSGLTAATADQNRVANLASTAGTLANQDITTRAGLGKTTADIGTAATAANLSAGQAQEKLGLDRQAAGYTDANALLSVGNQQQQLEQQQKSMPLQGLQYQQSLGQGWQLPTSSNFLNTSNTNSNSSGSQSQPQGSIAGQVVGAGATIAGALGGDDKNKNPDGTQKSARGGQINPFEHYATGGYVPTVTGMRKRNAMRTPPPPSPMGPMGGMGGMQPTGMPGMPPMAPPGAAALNPQGPPPPPMPHPANRRFARGGVFAGGGPFVGDEAQDRRMIERGIHQHERGMHKATTGQLTKLRLARGGGVPGYDVGGVAKMPGADPAILIDANNPFGDSTVFPKLDDRLKTVEDSVARFGPAMPVAAASPFISPSAGTGASEGSTGIGGSASDGSGGSAAAGTSSGPGDGVGGGDAGSGTYRRGGGVPGYRYGGLEISGSPTPRFRSNLPPISDQGDDSGGREVPPVNPLEWYQRANPRTQGEGSYVPGQWAALPEPDPRDVDKLNRLHQRNPEWYPQYDTPNMPRGNTPLPPAVVRAVLNRPAASPSRRAAALPEYAASQDEPRSGWRAWGYDPAPERAPAADRNFFDKLFSWFGGKGYHAAGGQANPLGTDSRAGFGSIYKEPIPAGKYGYAHGGGVPGFTGGGLFSGLSSMGGDAAGAGGGLGFNPMGYISDFAKIGMEIGNGDQGLTDSPQTPYDPLSNVWDNIYGVPREKYDETERVSSDVAGPVGRAIGDYFTGGIASPLFEEGFRRFGGGFGAAVQGHFGEAVNDLTQGTPLSFIKLAHGGGVPGYAEGTTAQRPIGGDRAALDEAPSTGPFGTMLRFSPIGATKADFGHFGPLAQQSLLGGSSGGGGGSGSGKGDISGMGDSLAKLLKLGKGLFGGSGDLTASGPLGTGEGGAYTVGDSGPGGILGSLGGGIQTGDIDTEIADWSNMGFAQGGEYDALDEDASNGPFGETMKTGAIGTSQANFGSFGPLAVGSPPVNISGGSGGGGAGSAMSGAGGMMGGLGGLLGGVSKIIPFLAEGGSVPGYASGGLGSVISGGGGGLPGMGGGLPGMDMIMQDPGAQMAMQFDPVLSQLLGGGGGGGLGGLGGLLGGGGGGGLFAHGGGVPGYYEGGPQGGSPGDVSDYGDYSQFLGSSEGLKDRLLADQQRRQYVRQGIAQNIADRRDYEARVPQPPSSEERVAMDAQAAYERRKGGLQRWGEQVAGDIAKPFGKMAGDIGQGDYASAVLDPLFGTLGSIPIAGANRFPLQQTAQELARLRMAHEAARRGVALRSATGQ